MVEKHDDMVDAFAYGMAVRGHTVRKYYDWKVIVMFLASGALLMWMYLINSEHGRTFIFGIVLGGYCSVVFRPWQKRWKYRMFLKDEKHYEFPPAMNFESPITGRKYNEKGEPQDG